MTAPDPTAGEHVIEERGRVYDRCRCGWYGSLGDTHVSASTGTSEDVETFADELDEHIAESVINDPEYRAALTPAEFSDWLAAREAAARAEALRAAADALDDHTACDCEDGDHLRRVAAPSWLRARAAREVRP